MQIALIDLILLAILLAVFFLVWRAFTTISLLRQDLDQARKEREAIQHSVQSLHALHRVDKDPAAASIRPAD
jgi:sensor domain CHASE-containing protein